MKETVRKLNNFGFLQWFGLVCFAIGGAALGFVAGFLLSSMWDIFGPRYHSAWQQFSGVILLCVPIPVGAYIRMKNFIKPSHKT